MNWVFSPHLLPLPPPPSLTPHLFPQSLASVRFLGTVVSTTVWINRQAKGGWRHKLQIPGLLPRVGSSKAGHSPPVWKKSEFFLEINSFLACLRLSYCLWLTQHPGICSQGPLCRSWHAQSRPPCSLLAYLCREGKHPHLSRVQGQPHTDQRGSEGLRGHGSWRGENTNSLGMALCPSPWGPRGLLGRGWPTQESSQAWLGHHCDLQRQLGTL